MAYGYPATPQAIGQALVQYQPLKLQAQQIAQPNASGAISKSFNDAFGGLADRQRPNEWAKVVQQLNDAYSRSRGIGTPAYGNPTDPYWTQVGAKSDPYGF